MNSIEGMSQAEANQGTPSRRQMRSTWVNSSSPNSILRLYSMYDMRPQGVSRITFH
jgi:hypothetical protein